jgi:hypothetical protein
MRRILACFFTLLGALLPLFVHAEPTSEARATARELFLQGRTLMESKDYRGACPKFEESQRLDPGGGTLLNLAICHELVGRTASAWAELGEALRVAKLDGRADRQALAEEHLRAIEPRISRITIVVPDAARVAGLEIRRDGIVLGSAAWNEAVPVDPGEHVIDASAPGKLSARQEIKIAGDGEKASVTIEPLADAPREESPPPPTPSIALDKPASEDRGRPLRIAGIAAGATGLASVAVGSIFGVVAIDARARAESQCLGAICSEKALSLNDRAATSADISTVLFIAGGVLLVGGITTFLLAPAKPTTTAQQGRR